MVRPRVVTVGLDDDEVGVVAAIAPLDLKHCYASWSEIGDQLSPSEVDIAVCRESPHISSAFLQAGVYILYVGREGPQVDGDLNGRFSWRDSKCFNASVSETTTFGEIDFSVPSEQLLASLTKDGAPIPHMRLSHSLISHHSLTPLQRDMPRQHPYHGPIREALIEASDGEAVAGLISHTDHSGIVLGLPAEADLASWCAEFLRYINLRDASVVPDPPPVLSVDYGWDTKAEADMSKEVERLEVEIASAKKRLDELASERSAAEEQENSAGIRRMLLMDGSDLVCAVKECLEDLGFVVVDEDVNQPDSSAPKIHDLTIDASPNDLSTPIVIEVKGYKNGVRTNDTRQIREHTQRYTASNGVVPTSWWVVNPHRGQSFGSRRIEPNAVDGAEIIGSVLLPTAELYQMWRSVDHGLVTREEARDRLVRAEPGLFRFNG